MRFLDLAKKMCNSSNCEVQIKRSGEQIVRSQKVSDLERKINDEIICDYTINTIEISDNKLIIHVK